jgi:hypothetical protein
MDSDSQNRYQTDPKRVLSAESGISENSGNGAGHNGKEHNGADKSVTQSAPPPLDGLTAEAIVEYLKRGDLLMVNDKRRNGLIIYKQFHAEFAGPGAMIGGWFDQDCQHVIPVGKLSLLVPETYEDRKKAYLIRRQWIRLTQQFTDKSSSVQRAQMILNQFENYFDAVTIARIPDEAFALLVGVLPHTVRQARRPVSPLNVKVKA